MAEGIDVERFGQRLRRVREQRGLTLKDVLQVTGLSIATLSRIERGGSKDIDGGTLVILTEWMGANADEFKSNAAPPVPRSGSVPDSIPEVVELYLRADKNLDKKSAALLTKMFKTAYDSLSKESTKKG